MATSIIRLKHLLQFKKRLGVVFDTFLAAATAASDVDRDDFKRELFAIFSLVREEGPIVETTNANTRFVDFDNVASNDIVIACICQLMSKVLKHGRDESHPERHVGKSSNASRSAAETSSCKSEFSTTISDLQIDAVEMFISHFHFFAGYIFSNSSTEFASNQENKENMRFFSQKAFFLKCLTDISKFISSSFNGDDTTPPLPLFSVWLTCIDGVLQSVILDDIANDDDDDDDDDHDHDDEIISSDSCVYYRLRILKLLKTQCNILDLMQEKMASSGKKRKHIDDVLVKSSVSSSSFSSSDEKYLDVAEMVQRLYCICKVIKAVVRRTLLNIKANRRSSYISSSVGCMSYEASISGASSSIFSGENILAVIVAMSFHVSAKLLNITARSRQLLTLTTSNVGASTSNLLQQRHLGLEENVARLTLDIKDAADVGFLSCMANRSYDGSQRYASSESSSNSPSHGDQVLFYLFDRFLAVDDTTLAGALVEISDFRGYNGLLKPPEEEEEEVVVECEVGDDVNKSRSSDFCGVSKENNRNLNRGSSSASIQRSSQVELQEKFSCVSLFLYYLHSMEPSKNLDFSHSPKKYKNDAGGNENIDNGINGGDNNDFNGVDNVFSHDDGEYGDDLVEEYDDDVDDEEDEEEDEEEDNYDHNSVSGLYVFLSSSGDTNLLLFVLRALKSLSACSGHTERLYGDFYLAKQLAKLKELKCVQMARSFQEETVGIHRTAGAIVYVARQIDILNKLHLLGAGAVMVDDDMSRQMRLELGFGNTKSSRVVVHYQDNKVKSEEVEVEVEKGTVLAVDENHISHSSGLKEGGKVNLRGLSSRVGICDDGARRNVDLLAFYRQTAIALANFECALLRAARRESKAHEEEGEETARLFFRPLLLLGPLSTAIAVVEELLNSTQ